MKLISKLKHIFPIISIITLIFFWGKKPAIYDGIFEGMSIIEHIILFILFSISFILQAREIYKKYKSENGKLPIKELLFSIIIVIISIIIIFNILKSGIDIINVNKLKNVCEEKIADFTYNLTLDGYSRRLSIKYDDFTTDQEKGTYDINCRIKDSGIITFEFKRESNELNSITMMISSMSEEAYKSPITLQSTLLITWDENAFEREDAENLIMDMLVKTHEQDGETYKGCSVEKGEYEISLSYFLDYWWTFSIYRD